jgi:hypothetical protein
MGGANCAIAFGEKHWTKTQMMNSVIHPVSGKEVQYKDLMKHPELGPLFEIGLVNELGRVCQGIRDISGTNTAFFVELASIPKDRKITYSRLVCDYKPKKMEKHRIRLTVGGNRLDYNGDTATSTADITTFKILINRTLSTKDAKNDDGYQKLQLRYAFAKDEFMLLPISILPEEIHLTRLAVDGWVYLEIRKGMYGLKQAGILAN